MLINITTDVVLFTILKNTYATNFSFILVREANLLYMVSILVYVLPKQAQLFN